MSKWTCLLLCVFLFFIPGITYPQQGYTSIKNIADFKLRLTAAAAKVATIESNFTQEKNLNVLSDKIISKGKFYFKKEKSLRWEYSEPYQYLIILHDDKIILRDENMVSKFDVQSNKMFREINTIILGCVQGTLLHDEKRFSSAFSENSSYYLVKLKPLGNPLKESLSEIWIFFDRSDLTVSKLEMHENSGDYTNISFSLKKINQTITDDKFKTN
jgi:outer membrane lipoprotein-sorting protein